MRPEASPKAMARAAREKKTVRAMVLMYCRAHGHGEKPPCEECGAIIEYASARIDGCPFIQDKPTCLSCSVHCYEESKRERIRTIMRYSGPRMVYRHPVLAVRHMVDGSKKPRERV